jgi:hypothetical protein
MIDNFLQMDIMPLIKNEILRKKGLADVSEMINQLDSTSNGLEEIYDDETIKDLLAEKNPTIESLMQRIKQSVAALMEQVRSNKNVFEVLTHDKFRKAINDLSQKYGDGTLVEDVFAKNVEVENKVPKDQLKSFEEDQKKWIAQRLEFYIAIDKAYKLVHSLVFLKTLLNVERLSDARSERIIFGTQIRDKLSNIIKALKVVTDGFTKVIQDETSHPKIKELMHMLYSEIILLNNQVLENYKEGRLKWTPPADTAKIREYETLLNQIFTLCDKQIWSICKRLNIDIGNNRATSISFELVPDTSKDAEIASKLL